MNNLVKGIIRAAGLGILLGLLALPSFAATTQMFTYGAAPVSKSNTVFMSCSAVLTVDGLTDTGHAFCPNQKTESDAVNGSNIGSLYLPAINVGSGIYEDDQITYGSKYNETFNSNGKLNTFDWDGSFSQVISGVTVTVNFTSHMVAVYYYNTRNQLMLAGYRVTGGSGIVTD
jgi:hypothetical protein